MKDVTLVSHLKSLAPPTPAAGRDKDAAGFAEALQTAVAEVNRLQTASDRAVEQVQTGDGKNLHETMIALEKADISLRLLVQMRNKVVEAYQEIMRMQV